MTSCNVKSLLPAFLTVLLWISGFNSACGEEAKEGTCLNNADGTCNEESATEFSWFDESTKKGKKFLEDHVFGQKSMKNVDETDSFSELMNPTDESSKDDEGSGGSNADDVWNWVFDFDFLKEAEDTLLGINKIVQDASKEASSREEESMKSKELTYINVLNYVAQKSAEKGESENNIRSMDQMFDLLAKSFDEAMVQVKRSELGKFLSGDHFTEVVLPAAFYYYLRQDEQAKNAVWKRRKHFFYPTLYDTATLHRLHNVLYLSNLAYADSKELIRKGIENFENDTWEPLFIMTEGIPTEPAHFIAIRKEVAALKNKRPVHTVNAKKPRNFLASLLSGKSGSAADEDDSTLELIIVVRGTKELGDVASDVLCEPADYRGYKAHGGIMSSGKYLVQKHVEMFRQLLEVSGRQKINLYIFGHSLGAGTAAIAAIEFDEYDFIEAKSIGFGTPSVLSPELSEQYKDMITTVVSDADIVPRITMASFANLFLDMANFDWTPMALDDVEPFLLDLQTKVPFGTKVLPTDKIAQFLQWMEDFFDATISKKYKNRQETMSVDHFPVPLIPPGNCIHLFRNGPGYTASHTPCDFFTEIEFVPTCIDDHLIPPGYHKLMLGVARDLSNDLNFDFHHDIVGTPLTAAEEATAAKKKLAAATA